LNFPVPAAIVRVDNAAEITNYPAEMGICEEHSIKIHIEEMHASSRSMTRKESNIAAATDDE
jgi:hypothetical protein